MRTNHLALGVFLLTANLTAATSPPGPNQVVIDSAHSGWSSSSTNLTLTWSNGVYSAGSYSVAPGLISNLLAAAKRPWPAAGSNVWPRFHVDLENLGLTAVWLKDNYPRLLQSFAQTNEDGPFPNASERQRTWLTNTLGKIEVLGEGIRSQLAGFWTDDYPSLEVRFENDDGQVLEQVLRLSTRAQPWFMLPWQISDGSGEWTSGNADISRALAKILPAGFMNRDRLEGDLLQMASAGFQNSRAVHEFMRQSTLEETCGKDADLSQQGFELRRASVDAGSFTRVPGTFWAELHRTNWPNRLVMPLQTGIERGVVTNLKALLSSADIRVAPLLKQEWLVARLNSSTNLSLEVKAQGSPDHEWLRGHMEKAGRAAFYDRIAPELRRSLGFLMREGFRRSSEWAVLPDGRLLMYGFTGDGVLNWTPEELGFQDDSRMLRSFSINRVGVFVGSDGQIMEVVPPERR